MAKANRKFRLRDDREAIVGVGTLIVFVATILVAAIASGVIIKTAYSLKDQAERTGLAAKQEITGGLKIIDVVGDRVNPGVAVAGTCFNCIRDVYVTATTWAGSDGINFWTMKVHWTGKSQNVYLSQNPSGLAGNQFVASATTFGADTSDGVASGGWQPNLAPAPGQYYVGDSLIMKIKIDTSSPPGSGISENGIAPGTTITLDFIPAHGPPVEEQFTTPNDYGTARYIDLTNT
jgi:archaellin